jgi:hypothetical protein
MQPALRRVLIDRVTLIDVGATTSWAWDQTKRMHRCVVSVHSTPRLQNPNVAHSLGGNSQSFCSDHKIEWNETFAVA